MAGASAGDTSDRCHPGEVPRVSHLLSSCLGAGSWSGVVPRRKTAANGVILAMHPGSNRRSCLIEEITAGATTTTQVHLRDARDVITSAQRFPHVSLPAHQGIA